jgi:hypothetical protein
VNPDNRVKAANRLGVPVTFDHPVRPRRDEKGAASCPVCGTGLSAPMRVDGPFRAVVDGLPNVRVTGMTVFSPACRQCKQIIDWSEPTSSGPGT